MAKKPIPMFSMWCVHRMHGGIEGGVVMAEKAGGTDWERTEDCGSGEKT